MSGTTGPGRRSPRRVGGLEAAADMVGGTEPPPGIVSRRVRRAENATARRIRTHAANSSKLGFCKRRTLPNTF